MSNNNNNTKQPEVVVKSYKISSNRDGSNTYSVEIETSAHTIVYPRAHIAFGANQSIAFPIEFKILDEDNNTIFFWCLNLNENEPAQSEQSNNQN